MPNRIIDQTESTTIVGTESIPGTEQVSTGETTPKNVRWTWNTVINWIYSLIGHQSFQKIILSGAGNTSTSFPQYTKVNGYCMIAEEGTTIKMGVAANQSLFMDEREDTAGALNLFFTSSNSAARTIRIETSAAATIYLFTTKSLNP